jgi:transcriptional regulator with XRE-family HTH domain
MRYSSYVDAMRGGREALKWSQVKLSSELGNSPSWAAMVESGARGIGLDSLVPVADKLGLDTQSFVKTYLAEKHPSVFSALYPDEAFPAGVRTAAAGSAMFDLSDRLQALPRELRRAIEATILAAYDATAGRKVGSKMS